MSFVNLLNQMPEIQLFELRKQLLNVSKIGVKKITD